MIDALLRQIEDSLAFWCQNCGVVRVRLDSEVPGDICCAQCHLVLVTFHAIGSKGEGQPVGLSKEA